MKFVILIIGLMSLNAASVWADAPFSAACVAPIEKDTDPEVVRNIHVIRWERRLGDAESMKAQVEKEMQDAYAAGSSDNPKDVPSWSDYQDKLAEVGGPLRCEDSNLTPEDKATIVSRYAALSNFAKPKPGPAPLVIAPPKANYNLPPLVSPTVFAYKNSVKGPYDMTPLGECEAGILESVHSSEESRKEKEKGPASCTIKLDANNPVDKKEQKSLAEIAEEANKLSDEEESKLKAMSEDELQDVAARKVLRALAYSVARAEGLSGALTGDVALSRLEQLAAACSKPSLASVIREAQSSISREIGKQGGQVPQSAADLSRNPLYLDQTDAQRASFHDVYISNLTKAAKAVVQFKNENAALLTQFNSGSQFTGPEGLVGFIPCAGMVSMLWDHYQNEKRFSDEKKNKRCALANREYEGMDTSDSPGMYQAFHDPNLDKDTAVTTALGCIHDARKIRENLQAMAAITAQFPELLQNIGWGGNSDLADYLATTPENTSNTPNPAAGTAIGDFLDKHLPKIGFNAKGRDQTVLNALQGMSAKDSPFARAIAQARKICDDPKSAAQAAFADPRLTEIIFDCAGTGGTSDKKECARLRKRGTLKAACNMRVNAAWDNASPAKDFLALAPLELDAVACVNFTGAAGKVFLQDGAKALVNNMLSNAVRFDSGMLTGAGIGGAMMGYDYYQGEKAADDAALRFALGSGSSEDFKAGGKGPDLTENLAWVVLGMFAGKVFEPEAHIPESFAKVKSDLLDGSIEARVRKAHELGFDSPEGKAIMKDIRVELNAPLIERGVVDLDKISIEKLLGMYQRAIENTPKDEKPVVAKSDSPKAEQTSRGPAMIQKLADVVPAHQSDLPEVVKQLIATAETDLSPDQRQLLKARIEAAMHSNYAPADVLSLARAASDIRVEKAFGDLKAAEAAGDPALLEKAGQAYMDFVDERLSWDPDRAKELETKYKDILDRTDPTQHDQMLGMLHVMDEQGMPREEINKRTKEILKGLCDACGACNAG